MASKDFKFSGAYGGKKDKKKGMGNVNKPHMPGSKKSGMDPHAMKDKWQDKQMKMLSKPKAKKKKMGMDPTKGM